MTMYNTLCCLYLWFLRSSYVYGVSAYLTQWPPACLSLMISYAPCPAFMNFRSASLHRTTAASRLRARCKGRASHCGG